MIKHSYFFILLTLFSCSKDENNQFSSDQTFLERFHDTTWRIDIEYDDGTSLTLLRSFSKDQPPYHLSFYRDVSELEYGENEGGYCSAIGTDPSQIEILVNKYDTFEYSKTYSDGDINYYEFKVSGSRILRRVRQNNEQWGDPQLHTQVNLTYKENYLLCGYRHRTFRNKFD